MTIGKEIEIEISLLQNNLPGILFLPQGAIGLVIFVHGSGSSRFSDRNRFVANSLQQAGLGTLLFDLLDQSEAEDRKNIFDIELLASRVDQVAQWLSTKVETQHLVLGYFGASTGAAAALVAAANYPSGVKAVVSRGGRPDLAGEYLKQVTAATLLIIGERDQKVIEFNQQAFKELSCEKELVVVPRATHLFPEEGALEEVANLACNWFVKHLHPADLPE